MLKSIVMVPIIMGCALFGTVGMIKGIKKIFPSQFNDEKNSSKQAGNDRG